MEHYFQLASDMLDGRNGYPAYWLKSEVITAVHSAEERAAAVAEFNDLSSKCHILDTTYIRGGTGLNLHNCCNVVMLLEPATNLNIETRAIGRFHRISKRNPQRIYPIF